MISDDTTRLNTEIATFMQVDAGTDFESTISQALPVAEKLQTIGYRFQLKDLCRKDMCSTRWAAIFTDEQGTVIREEHENAATAICRAAQKILLTPKH
ncbi:MAG: hypothetical protein WC124_14010 [Desulfoplanes sp.]|jgi:hypothetical protein